ncbi:arylsulfatase [Mariniblastus fucicola]|nr:arylsulfatase [Mariniblastus fucicola]
MKFGLSLAVTFAASSFTVFALSAAETESETSPNVIVILTDDQGWGDLSLHGNPNLSTPHLDQLARQGAQIENFYVCPVCSPTRAEFLTGRYHTRMNVFSTSAGGERINADEQTIADVFRDAGYSTAGFGKWHNGMQFPYHPNARGFDEFYGFCSGHWGHYFSPMLEHNGEIVQGDGFLPDDLTNRAIQFIDKSKSKPFFVYLALNTPHSPMQVPEKYWNRFRDKEIVPDPAPENQKGIALEHTRAALAMCENIDHNVGRLMQHLDQSQRTDSTIVVYFCDNGPNGKRFNGGMRGRKGSTFEGGVRSPCFVRYPKSIKPGTEVKRISATIDLLPTLAEMAGIGLNSPKPLDGVSIKQALEGDASTPDRFLFSAWNGKTTVRSQTHRMQRDGSLFDLRNDPGEQNNVAKSQPEIAMKLGKALADWEKETSPKPAKSRLTRPFTLGHQDAVWTQLPARDATPTGTITRSNRYPNCTFMENWTDTESQIIWDVDVLAAGNFEVQMYYSCDADDVGSTVRLSCGDATLSAEITIANEVPLIGAAEDRFERAEGYVRRWKPMDLGKIKLKAGRQKLVLQAEEVVGDQVANMRLLMFRRVD